MPLVSANGGTAGPKMLTEHPYGTQRYLPSTTAGFLHFSSKGPNGTTGIAVVVPPGLAAIIPIVVSLQLGIVVCHGAVVLISWR